jgi:hypothetical protein
MYWPGGHASRTEVHADALSAPEKVVPTVHALQTRSALADPVFTTPNPSLHVFHAAQEGALPAVALK